MLEKGPAAGIETRGVADHGAIQSIYFRDPNGCVVELAARTGQSMSGAEKARQALDAWQNKQQTSIA
jgi:catechol-2,3-dioxygenase